MNLRFLRHFFFGKQTDAEPQPESDTTPQQPMSFILNYSEGQELTSVVTKEKIRQALDRIEQYGNIWLSNCRDVVTPYGYCSGISCTHIPEENPQVAVYFTCPNGLTRHISQNYTPNEVADMFYNFFDRLEIPDITGWSKSDFTRMDPETAPCILYVDNEKFEFIDYQDVTAAFEKLKEGQCKALLLRTPDDNYGYLEVRGTLDDYIVEIGGHNTQGDWVVYTTTTQYGGHVLFWLNNYYNKREFPRITDEWTDITEEMSEADE